MRKTAPKHDQTDHWKWLYEQGQLSRQYALDAAKIDRDALSHCSEIRIQLEAELDRLKTRINLLENMVRWSLNHEGECLKALNAELLAALERISAGEVMSGEFTHAETVLSYQALARKAIAKALESA